MADTFTLQVITPMGIEVEAQVAEVEVPSTEGEIGFLPGHVPYAGIVDVGLLHYQEVAGIEKKIVVKKGFCSFLDDKLTVLADSVRLTPATSEEVSKKDQLNNELAATQDEVQWEHLRDSLKEIEAAESLT